MGMVVRGAAFRVARRFVVLERFATVQTTFAFAVRVLFRAVAMVALHLPKIQRTAENAATIAAMASAYLANVNAGRVKLLVAINSVVATFRRIP
jgi:hypothetical protein